MADDDVDVDVAAFDHVVLQVFEDQEDRSGVLTYPLTSQRQALDFVKLMNRKGFPYQQMCDDIGEKPETFRSWRLGNGNGHIGQIMMKRINKTIQEAMSMTDGDAEHDQYEIEADGFLDDIDSDGHEDQDHSSSVDISVEHKNSSLPNGELEKSVVNDDAVLPHDIDVLVGKTEGETICDRANVVQAPETFSDVTKISDNTKTGDVVVISDSLKPRDTVTHEDLPDPVSVKSNQVKCDEQVKQEVGAMYDVIKTLEAKNVIRLPSSSDTVEVMPIVSDQLHNDSLAAAVTDTVRSDVIIPKETDRTSQPVTATEVAKIEVNASSNLSETSIKSKTNELVDSSCPERTSPCDATGAVDKSGEQFTSDVPHAHKNHVIGALEMLNSGRTDELVGDAVTDSLTKKKVDTVTTDESKPFKDNEVQSAEITPNNPVEPAVNEQTSVKEEPIKVEYEASSKQLSLLNRLAMLKEKAGQKSPITGGETSDGSTGKMPSLPVSPTTELSLSFTSSSKDAIDKTGHPVVNTEKAITKSSVTQPLDKSPKTESSTLVATPLQKRSEEEPNSKAKLEATCEVSMSLTPRNENVESQSKISTSTDTCARDASGLDSSIKNTAMISTKTVDSPHKSRAEINAKPTVKPDLNSVDTVTPGTNSKSSTETAVDTLSKSTGEISAKIEQHASLKLHPTTVTPKTDSKVVNEAEKNQSYPANPPNTKPPVPMTSEISSEVVNKTDGILSATKETINLDITGENKRGIETNTIKSTIIGGGDRESKSKSNDLVESGDSLTENGSSVKSESDIINRANDKNEPKAVESHINNRQIVDIALKDNNKSAGAEFNAKSDKQEPLSVMIPNSKLTDAKNVETTCLEIDAIGVEQQKSLKNPPAAAVAAGKDSQKSLSITDVAKQQLDPARKECENKQIDPSATQEVVKLVPTTSAQRDPDRSVGQRVKTAGRRLDFVFDSIYDGSVTENYDSDLDISGTNEKTYSLVDRVRRLKTSPVETPGYLYVFTDSPTNDGETTTTTERKVTGTWLPRFKVGSSRFPGKRLRQATCFNPEMKPFIVVSVKRRLEALRMAREKLEQFQVTGTSDWFACDDDVIASAVDMVVNEMKP